jgi:hypothetical protein
VVKAMNNCKISSYPDARKGTHSFNLTYIQICKSDKSKMQIKLKNLKETGQEDVDWMHLAQDTDQSLDLVNTVMNLQVP